MSKKSVKLYQEIVFLIYKELWCFIIEYDYTQSATFYLNMTLLNQNTTHTHSHEFE